MTDIVFLTILAVLITALWCIAIIYDSFVGGAVAAAMSMIWLTMLGDLE